MNTGQFNSKLLKMKFIKITLFATIAVAFVSAAPPFNHHPTSSQSNRQPGDRVESNAGDNPEQGESYDQPIASNFNRRSRNSRNPFDDDDGSQNKAWAQACTTVDGVEQCRESYDSGNGRSVQANAEMESGSSPTQGNGNRQSNRTQRRRQRLNSARNQQQTTFGNNGYSTNGSGRGRRQQTQNSRSTEGLF